MIWDYITSWFGKGNRTEVCPYCFEYFVIKETPFRCTNPPEKCAPEVDEVLGKVWNDRRPVGKIIPPANTYTKKLRCKTCNGISRKRVCPHCHCQLPHTIGEYQNYIFSIIGAKESGKSHFVAVIINELKHRVGPECNILLEPLNDETIYRYNEDFFKPLYQNGVKLQATRSSRTNQNLPLVYSLSILKKNLWGKEVIDSVSILVFFDTAGEDLNSEDTMSAVNKYIIRSHGMILLIDSLQIASVRDQLQSTTGLPNQNTEVGEIISRVNRLIRKGHEMDQETKIKIPIAVTFSKMDALQNLYPTNHIFLTHPNYKTGFDHDDFVRMNDELKELMLKEWHQNYIEILLRTNFSDYGYFGISSLGCNPHMNNERIQVRPIRIESPIMWLLYKNELISKV